MADSDAWKAENKCSETDLLTLLGIRRSEFPGLTILRTIELALDRIDVIELD